MGVALTRMTLDEFHDEILHGKYATDDVHMEVLGYDVVMYERMRDVGKLRADLEEELVYMSATDYVRLVERLELPIALEV